MVQIIDWKKVEPKDGSKPFNALVLQGDLDLVRSKTTGNIYATAKKTQITSTFDELTCKQLIGKKLPGKIIKVVTDDYEYTVQETGEVITIGYTFKYDDGAVDVEEAVFEKELVGA